eukprot:1816590-Rhodomonas_salina.3
MLLRTCYAMYGTYLRYDPTHLLHNVWYWPTLCSYALATQCPIAYEMPYAMLLRKCYAEPSTELCYAATRRSGGLLAS